MNLSTASITQLIEWQAQLVAELARRAQPPAPPPQPRAPWEMGPYVGAEGRARAAAERAAIVRGDAEYAPDGHGVAAPPDIQAAISAAVAQALAAQQPPAPTPRNFTNLAPPAMLGGQSTRAVVTTTPKTDPVLAAKFAAVPPRPDIVDPETGRVFAAPGLQGNGKGEGGAVEFGVPVGPEG